MKRPRLGSPDLATVRIEGVAFELEDAREFCERVVVYVEATPPMHPERQLAAALAMQIYACLRGKGPCDMTLWDETKVVASAVLAEWAQSRDAPDAAGTLYRALAS